tara:strand:+ start:300 stop:776 length:477 start_codon:yes stop_codon:yes gene_type:complete
MKNYIYLCVYNNENSTEDFLIYYSSVTRNNGEYILSFNLDSDGDGVVDTYHFYDIKSKVSGQSSGPWGFDEFTDINEELTEHESLEDFDFDSNVIGSELEDIRSEFIKIYLNEESQKDLLNKAAVPFNKREILKEDISSGNLVFEEGDKSILPPNLQV